MESVIIADKDFGEDHAIVPQDVDCVFFRLVGVGENTLNAKERKLAGVKDLVDKQPSFVIISLREGMREALHQLVDNFCDSRE